MTWRNSCSISFAPVVSESSWYERRMFKKADAVQMRLKIGAGLPNQGHPNAWFAN